MIKIIECESCKYVLKYIEYEDDKNKSNNKCGIKIEY